MSRQHPKPVYSMTGSGLVRGKTDLGDVTVELRAVNGRNLSLKMRFSNECQGLETAFEAYLRKRLQRGSVTLVINVTAPNVAADSMIDEAAARAAAECLTRLATELGVEGPPRLADVLSMPGVIPATQSSRLKTSWEPPADLHALVVEATDRLLESRAQEGTATVSAMVEQLDAFDASLARVKERAPTVIAEFRERLKARVDEFLADRGRAMEDADVIREVALFAERADVAEELQRLDIHLVSARKLFADGGTMGRNLEFLLQEFLREVNTLGSKSPDAGGTHEVVAMKSCIDKLKEQAANLE